MRIPHALLLCVALVPAGHLAQTFDRTLRRIDNQVIMTSDVQLARVLKLVAPAADSDDAILVALENRLLVLVEVSRAAQPDPSADEIAARRRQWERGLGPGASVATLLDTAHMSEASLAAWLRDDARIQKYEDQRFGRRPDPPGEIARWIQDLRKRAGLK